MRVLLLVIVLAAGCSSNEDCARAAFYRYDPQKKCVSRAATTGDCAEAAGPPTTRCSLSADGTTYWSYEGRVFPGGTECTTAQRSALGDPPQCP